MWIGLIELYQQEFASVTYSAVLTLWATFKPFFSFPHWFLNSATIVCLVQFILQGCNLRSILYCTFSVYDFGFCSLLVGSVCPFTFPEGITLTWIIRYSDFQFLFLKFHGRNILNFHFLVTGVRYSLKTFTSYKAFFFVFSLSSFSENSLTSSSLMEANLLANAFPF